MSSLSLLDEKWLPVIHFDGHFSKIRPCELVDETITDLAYPRPDFQGAAYQFLIGLLQTTFSPEDHEQWREYWADGFEQSQLDKAFLQVQSAMQFGQTKPAFMQDFDTLGSDPLPISGLLVEAPGENALKKNTDHFIKRDFVKAICPHCAVITLFSLQANAPAGGQGHRVSLRGGGPITTLLMPELDKPTPLWKKLWLNVIPLSDADKPHKFDESVFPWLNSTKTSEKPNQIITPEKANYCQSFWGMPRRIELDFQDVQQGKCDLCGESSTQLITHYQTKNYGVQYENWIHPLTPYRKDSKTGSLLSIKGQPGGLIYRDWLSMVIDSGGIEAATVVKNHYRRRLKPTERFGLWCFGFDFDNMKARCWYEHAFPVIPALADTDNDLSDLISLALELAKEDLPLLRKAMKAINRESSAVDIAYWKETESAFYGFVKNLINDQDNADKQQQSLSRWADTLRNYIMSTFDKAAFANPDEKLELSHQVSAREKLLTDFNKMKYFKQIKNTK